MREPISEEHHSEEYPGVHTAPREKAWVRLSAAPTAPSLRKRWCQGSGGRVDRV